MKNNRKKAYFHILFCVYIALYDDAIIATNMNSFNINGCLPKLPVEQIYAGVGSRARNQRIQNMLRMIGYGENIGSGFPLILKAWDQNHWLKPELFEQPEQMQVRLVLTIEPKDVGKDGINPPSGWPQGRTLGRK